MGTTLTPVSSFDAVVCPNPGEVIRAGGGIGTTITIRGVTLDGDLTYTGLVLGARVKHLGGASKTLAVTVAGNDVTVQLGTDAGSNVTSTATAVVNKILTVPAALALLSVTAEGTGLGTPTVVDWVALGLGPVGSIRISLQALLNRTKYIYDKIIFGLLSFKSLTIDTTGETVVTPTPGQGTADVWQTGNSLAEGGRFTTSAIKFRNVTALGNPAGTTALNNDLRPINITKAWGLLSTNGTGGITVLDSCSTSSAIIIPGNGVIKVTMATPMASVYYVPNVTLHYSSATDIYKLNAKPQILNASEFYINVYDSTSATPIDVSTKSLIVSYSVNGRQL